MQLPDLSIIIVNYRGWKPLRRLLTALSVMPKQPLNFEVIVVDNCSYDEQYIEFSAAFPEIHFIENEGNYGFANGCNLGAKSANAELLLFLNPDTMPAYDALNRLVDEYRQSPARFSLLSCRESAKQPAKISLFPTIYTLTAFSRFVYRIFHQSEISAKSCNASGIASPDWVSGSIVLISREWFGKIGGWNEDFWMYSEDVDLCKRVSDAGGKIGLLCDTFIQHDHGGTSRINVQTEALTKTEVLISQHVYVNLHFPENQKALAHTLLIIRNLFTKFCLAILGIIFFIIPKLRAQTSVFFRLIQYYISVLLHRTWLSERSVNFARSVLRHG